MNYLPIFTEKTSGNRNVANGDIIRVFKQLKREGDLAIYSVSSEKTGKIFCYEVVKIGRHDGRQIGENYMEPAELYPSSSLWGQEGWTLMTLARAEEKFKEIQERERAIAAGEIKAKGRKKLT